MTFCSPAQCGKSTVLENSLGQRLDDRPKPVLLVLPTEQLAKTRTGPRIQRYLQETPVLWERTARGKAFARTQMTVAGASLRLAWAGSVSQLASDSVADVFVDEVDQMAGSVNAQGGVLEQAEARNAAFEDGILVVCSTPTEGNVQPEEDERTGLVHWKVALGAQLASMVWTKWQEGTRHEYAVPCPSCSEFFVPRSDLLVYPKDGTAVEIRDQAGVACPHCGAVAREEWRDWMRRRGVYVCPGQKPAPWVEGASSVTVHDVVAGTEHDVELGDFVRGGDTAANDPSFWVSGLLNWNRKRSFGFLAVRLARALRSGDPAALRGVKNLQLGECVWFGGDAPSVEQVSTKKDARKVGDVPDWARALFLTVDVQGDRLVWLIRAHGQREASALVDHGELWGSTKKVDVWNQLTDLAGERYGGRKISRVAVDSGFLPEQVYTWVLGFGSRAHATKGQSTNIAKAPYRASEIEVTDQTGRKRTITLWLLDVDRLKLWVHTQIDGGPKSRPLWTVPADVSEDYLAQVVAEERIRQGDRFVWKRTGPNHLLDCEALQRFLGVHYKRALNRIEAEEAAPKPVTDQQQRRIFRRRTKRDRGAW